MVGLDSSALDPKVGKAFGWRLNIAGQEIDHQHCWADIRVSMDSGISPGSIVLDIRRMTQDQFRAIASRWHTRETAPGERAPDRATVEGKLFLFWRDLVGNTPTENAAPVLFEFGLTALSRRSEGLEIITHIEGRDLTYHRIVKAKTSNFKVPQTAQGPLELAGRVMGLAGLGNFYSLHEPVGGDSTGTDIPMSVSPNSPILPQLNEAGNAMLRRYSRRGREVYLIRRGRLHIGPFRPVPITGSAVTLNPAAGFLTARLEGQDSPIALTERLSDASAAPQPRQRWRVNLVGRADIGPGDVVVFEVPAEDAALFDGFGVAGLADGLLPPVTVHLYVASVSHRANRNESWTTDLVGVSMSGPPYDTAAWDEAHTTPHGTPSSGDPTPRADPAGTIRSRVEGIVAHELAFRPNTDIGEVRQANTRTQMSGDSVSLPAHSSELLVGTVDRSGAGAARFAEIQRTGEWRFANSVPYTTPFAWGPFGLVLPRYPGTRVLVSYHHGSMHDPVDIGALWRTSDDSPQSAPTNNQPGDWWLILPAGMGDAASNAEGARDPVEIPSDAKASHDLIDADGQRLMAVGGLTIRAYELDSMVGPGDRPALPADPQLGGILIEHVKSGAAISIDNDGKITIKAVKELVLEGDGIKLRPGSGTVDVE